MSEHRQTPFLAALISGGIAGTSVDIALFPLDTIKTRLQSSAGFLKSGGFSGVYRGLSAAAAGSAPGAALFFSTYETSKQFLQGSVLPDPVVHMTAASCGEVAACLVRVPTEVVKQRMQAGLGGSAIRTIRTIIASEGGVSGLYRGFGITIMREIPFAFIQFPIYEYAKRRVAEWMNRPIQSYEAALCGSLAGGFAAAVTTPLDVIKTRLMLGADASGARYLGPIDTFQRVLKEGNERIDPQTGRKLGARILLAGIQPRVMWISIGGFVFFGAYEYAVRFTTPLFARV